MKKPPGSILIVHRSGGLGDILISSAVPHALKEAWSASRITFLTTPQGRHVLEGNPYIDEIKYFDISQREWRLAPQASSLSRGRYDAAIVLWSTAFEAWMLRLSGIPVRVGQGARILYSFLYTHRVRIRSELGDVDSHWAEILLDYVRALGVSPGRPQIHFPISPGALREGEGLLRSRGSGPDDLLVGFHIGKGLPLGSVAWPLDAFIAFGRAVLEAVPCRLVLTGSKDEAPLVARLRDALGERCIDVAGATDIPLLGGVIARCKAFVCPDSFPMHVSAALGVPTAGIFALKSDFPGRWRPFGTRYHVVRPREFGCSRPCVKEQCKDFSCYRKVDPGDVASALRDLLAGGGHKDWEAVGNA
jgi:ADP-heptose:LPS heptosyltransferase